MRKAHGFSHTPRIMDIAARATGTFLGQRRPVIVKLQRDTHHIIALFGQNRGHHRAIDAARHGDDDAGLRRGLGQVKRIEHPGLIQRHGRS